MLLISLGIILLLNNFNVLPWGIWESLWKFWPILLISWGLDAVFGHGWVGYTITSILGIILLFFVIAYCVSLVNPNFDKWIQIQIPRWSELKNQIPNNNPSPQTKVFRCNPSTGDCTILYR